MATRGSFVKEDPYGIKAEHVLKLDDETWTKGEVQDGGCRDAIWAVLFYCQLAALLATYMFYLAENIETGESEETYDSLPFVYLSAICGGFGFLFSGISILVMIATAEVLIKMSLYFVVGMSFVFAVIGFASNQIIIGVFSIISFMLGLCYIYLVRSRIPFATCNLVTSLTAIESNFGVVFVVYFMTALGIVWSMIWFMALIGLNYTVCGDSLCDEEDNTPWGYMFLLLVSYYWTYQVILNVAHVTVAGVVGSWWFGPDETSFCCSKAVLGSFSRSLSTSFGSICLGSLIVAIIQALRQMARAARENNDSAILMCIVECILACIGDLIEYFNKWAFIYVGVYGYGYYEAGKKVMQLFHDRGWDAIIVDDLVDNALLLVSFIIGLITGSVGTIIATTTDWFNEFEDAGMGCFFIGFIIGVVLANIMFSVVSSGVSTVIVCFADAPAEFQTNHPELSNKMRDCWQSSFPNCFTY